MKKSLNLSEPVQIYDFDEEALAATNPGSFDLSAGDSSVADPVSICFGSPASVPPQSPLKSKNDTSDDKDVNPKGDLTLFILTSNTDVYKIYPFLPQQLSVSQNWISKMFNYYSLSFNAESEAGIENQAQFLPTLKFAVLLSAPECNVKEQLPPTLQKGKIVGPLLIKPFPEVLYEDDALQLIPMVNDVLTIVTNHSVLAVFDDQSGGMMFENQVVDENDDGMLTTLELVIFHDSNCDIDSAFLQPNTIGSLVLTTSGPTLLQVDFSEWMTDLQKFQEHQNNNHKLHKLQPHWLMFLFH
ncbi:unnamed protein product [Ambrosiozyma monospora]|uniref:Unnamed protein product n=1 Tax=Ambrosiozyma monospora TaxID=43982 RepID=A0ACB5TSI8_AMBMO|nr:unnamed protein product [Ambrosiozyma monospora]